MSAPKPKPKLSYKAQSFPSSDKPFECTACQLYFRRLHDLKRHERLHTGERPYCCNNCRRTFARLDALKRHLSAESNVHCSEWTYQPGAVSGLTRPAVRHHRSISLPHVHATDARAYLHDQNDSDERTPTTPSPKDHPSFHLHYHRHHLQSSPESIIRERHPEENDIREQDESAYLTRSSTDPEHQCYQDRLRWGMASKRSMPQLNSERPLLSDMIVDDDASLEQSRSRAAAASFEAMQLSPATTSYPQTHFPPHARAYSHSFSHSHSHSHPHSDPHLQQPLSPFNKIQLRQRRESYPVSPSRSTLSPSPSPGLSPSPSSMSASTMSSPTNIWSYSRGFDAFDSTAPSTNNHTRVEGHHQQLQQQHQHETWAQPRPEQPSSSFSQRLGGNAVSRHGLAPFQEEGANHEYRHLREFDRRQGPSLASILNSPSPSNPYPASADQTPPVPTPATGQSSSRPLHPQHLHSHSYSHPQQLHLRHSEKYSPPHEHEFSCGAMVEIKKLREELQWVTMKYHTLVEKEKGTGTGSINGNHSDGSGRGSSHDDRSSMSA